MAEKLLTNELTTALTGLSFIFWKVVIIFHLQKNNTVSCSLV
jgi:hypothetical protein